MVCKSGARARPCRSYLKLKVTASGEMALAPTVTGETTPALAASFPVTSDSDPLPNLQLPLDLRLSPEQFALVYATNPPAVLEPDAATPVRQVPAPEDGGIHRQCCPAGLVAVS
jgi:hypothetical protein